MKIHHIHFMRIAYLTRGRALAYCPPPMSPITKKADIRPAKGKLGVLLPGMGAVATTFIAGVEAIRRGSRQADRLDDPDGHDPPRQAHRQPLAEDQRLRAARHARRSRVRRLGHLRGQRLRVGEARRRALERGPREGPSVPREHPADAGRVRAGVRQEAARHLRQEGQDRRWSWPSSSWPTSSASRRPTASTAASRSGAARPRSIASRRTCTRRWRSSKQGLHEQRREHRAVGDLRLRAALRSGVPLRQRRAEPVGRLPGDARSWPSRRTCRSAARTSRPARR